MDYDFFLLYNIDMSKKLHRKRLKQIARMHALFSIGAFLLYIGLSIIYSPDFLFSDIRNKYKVAADGMVTVTAKVLAPPVKPVITGSSRCTNGNLFNIISWPADENTESFNVFKNGSLLASGISSTQFADNFISTNSSYEYKVAAIGQMGPGVADSDSITIVTPVKCNVIPPALITTANFNSLKGYSKYTTTNHRPNFSGTSNIPFAIIKIAIHSSQIIFGQTTANVNGYWSWIPPVDISADSHTFFIKAQDPNDPSRVALSSFAFEIKSDENYSKTTNNSNKQNNSKQTTIPAAEQIINQNTESTQNNSSNQVQTERQAFEEKTLDFSLVLEKSSIDQGKNLEIIIKIDKSDSNDKKSESSINYKIFNSNSEEVLTFTDRKIIGQNDIIAKNITIPKILSQGSYKLQIETGNEKCSVSKDVYFSVKAAPFLNLGGGSVITYPEILSRFGSIALWMIFFLLIWLALFSREYWLYLHSMNNITERHLAKIGSFGARKRKGVRL